MGRPTKFTDAVLSEICERLGKGEPMAQICRDEGMPAYRTVKDWIDSRDDVSAAIARAREEGFDAIATECLEIADDSRNDWIEAKAEEGDERAGTARSNGEVIQRSKLRIETRLKLLSKWDPKRYGDKVTTEITGADGGPVQVSDATGIDSRIAELQAKLAAITP